MTLAARGLAALGVALASHAVAAAAPLVLRGSALATLDGVPELGRGYAATANAITDRCLTDVVQQRPVTDVTGALTAIADGAAAVELAPDHRVPLRELVDDPAWRGADGTYRHRLLLTSTIDVYYAALDEAKARVTRADATREVGDRASFVEACGTHYVRSVSRRGVVASVEVEPWFSRPELTWLVDPETFRSDVRSRFELRQAFLTNGGFVGELRRARRANSCPRPAVDRCLAELNRTAFATSYPTITACRTIDETLVEGRELPCGDQP